MADSQNATNSDSVTITVGNSAPVATILSPVNGSKYSIGDAIVFNGTGTDNENGALTGASLSWEVILHHNEHVHFNFFNWTGNSGSFVVPDHGDNSWLELCLTATDSGGLVNTNCVQLTPNAASITLKTKPAGMLLFYDGVSRVTPFVVTIPVGSVRDISAPLTQGNRSFKSWSDGGIAAHQITVVGTQSVTYTATYSAGKK